MSQLLEQKINSNEQQPEKQFELSKVAIDRISSPNPRFRFSESTESDSEGERRIGLATTKDTIGVSDQISETAFWIDAQGKMRYTVGDEIEIVVLHGDDGSVTELGADTGIDGVIEDIDARDEIYILAKEFASIIKTVGPLDKNAFDTIMASDEIKADVVRMTFEEAFADRVVSGEKDESKHSQRQAGMTPHQRRLNTERIFQDRLTALQEKDPQKYDVVSPVDLAQAFADDKELQAQITAAKGYKVTDKRHRKTPGKELEVYRGDVTTNASSMGISEAVRDELEKERLAERVEKYTEKVATYEEIAAKALGRRMKGRLFNPLTRTNKDKVREDDQSMHLLEGFSRVLDASLMQQWLAEGYSDDEVATKIYEHQQTRQEARAARNHEELRKDKLASFLDKYANMSKGKKIGAAIGAAAVFGVIGIAAGAAGGALAAAGGIGLAGAKVGKTYFQNYSKIYETGRDESMQSPDRPVSVKNGEATTRTAIEQVFAGRQHDEKKRENAIQKADRIKKVAAGLAAISAVAIGAGVAMKIAEHGDDIQKMWNKPLTPPVPDIVGDADGSWVTEPPVSELAPNPAVEFSVDASTVANGEGWYQTIQEVTGPISPTEQAAILQKIGPALQEKGWAYPMSDGTWGISRPGTLPKDVLELIKNSR